MRWIEDYLAGGGTLMLVSHSMYHVQKLCRRAVWIQRGRIEAIGDVHEVTQRYLAWQETRIAADSAAAQQGASGLEFQTRTLAVNGVGEGSPLSIDAGGTIEVVARVRSSSGRVPVLGVGIVRGDGAPVYGVTSEMDGAAPRREGADGYRFVLRFPALALLPGTYTVRAHAMDPEALRLFDTVEQPFTVPAAAANWGWCACRTIGSGIRERGGGGRATRSDRADPRRRRRAVRLPRQPAPHAAAAGRLQLVDDASGDPRVGALLHAFSAAAPCALALRAGAQPRLRRHRQRGDGARARRRGVAQFRYRGHARLAAAAGALRCDRAAPRHRDAMVEQCRDLLLPLFCRANPVPADPDTVAAAAARLAAEYPELPTAVASAC